MAGNSEHSLIFFIFRKVKSVLFYGAKALLEAESSYRQLKLTVMDIFVIANPGVPVPNSGETVL